MELDDMKEGMSKAIQSLKNAFQGLRTARANPALLERIKADVYGSATPIQQIATITVPEPRILSVQVWDKANVKSLEKAIRESSLGLNPQIDGNVIRIVLPELTKERREDLSKQAAKYAEEARVAIRNVRRDSMDDVKKQEKDNIISEDARDRISKDIQKATDQFIADVDQLLEAKKKDIMSV